MIELIGELIYEIDEEVLIYNTYKRIDKNTIRKDLLIHFPYEKGISILEDGRLYLSNTYLAEKNIREIFYGIDLQINFVEIYYYELEMNVLIKVNIRLKSEKDIKKFLRKNKIANMLYES